ncbi:MAG: hypothetical protein HKP48_10640 [Winogradskyella sp.]|uniref:hypothetical protein n=1 Tax=Winogradskyella sp. TaxID=1883156 RepID=UPI00183DD710|nr:hypothetical protein [Winogradskyella sp.]MBT8246133.1 hypothetical protein [Winogradskyella sp.]NNK23721.1 hypothetical protein [Winogradskyella sp.]
MTRHYSNNGKNPLYPHNYKAAWIEIDLKDTSRDFRQALLKIINVFDSIKSSSQDSLELKILLKRKKSPPPPPPPKSDKN